MVINYAAIFRPARSRAGIRHRVHHVELFKDSTGSSRQFPQHLTKAAQPNHCAAFVYRLIPKPTFTARIN